MSGSNAPNAPASAPVGRPVPPPAVTPRPTLRLVLGLLPVGVVVLWLYGLSVFRGYDISPIGYLVLGAMLFAMGTFLARLRRTTQVRRRPEPRPFRTATFAAAILAALALVLGGALEIALQMDDPNQKAPLALRIGWHVGCAFAAGWSRFASQFLPR